MFNLCDEFVEFFGEEVLDDGDGVLLFFILVGDWFLLLLAGDGSSEMLLSWCVGWCGAGELDIQVGVSLGIDEAACGSQFFFPHEVSDEHGDSLGDSRLDC